MRQCPICGTVDYEDGAIIRHHFKCGNSIMLAMSPEGEAFYQKIRNMIQQNQEAIRSPGGWVMGLLERMEEKDDSTD